MNPRLFSALPALIFAALTLAALPVRAQYPPPPGRVLLFSEPNYRGEVLVVEAGSAIENLEYVHDRHGRKWNDRIASVRLEGPVFLIVSEHSRFRGVQATLTRNVSDLAALSRGDRDGPVWDRMISSLRVEAVPPGAPLFIPWNRREAERAVRSAYRDLLGREPDERGLREYRDRLMERGWTEDQLRDNLRRSPEFRNRDLDAIIRKVYREVLERNPDPSGSASYRRALQNGMSEAELRAELLRSPERAALVARQCVTRAYREVLRRDPDPAGLANYTKLMLERGWNEDRVRESLRQSDEYRNQHRR